jgi:hypothetical protein
VEFREHGILAGAVLWPWEKIGEWRWAEKGSTLFVKTGYAVLSFRLRADDKAAAETVLKEHVVFAQAASR